MSRRGTKARRAAHRRHRYYSIVENPKLVGAAEYYDLDGKPCTLGKWAAIFEDRSLRFLGRTKLRNGYVVSTVWIGIDHTLTFNQGNQPIIFETMVFHGNASSDLDCVRYATKKEALAGHRALVAKWKLKPKLEVVRC